MTYDHAGLKVQHTVLRGSCLITLRIWIAGMNMSSHDDPDPEAGSIDQFEPARSGYRLLRLPEVMSKVGLRRTAIYERMKRGCFPQSRSLGTRCTVWLETEIDEWIENIVS